MERRTPPAVEPAYSTYLCCADPDLTLSLGGGPLVLLQAHHRQIGRAVIASRIASENRGREPSRTSMLERIKVASMPKPLPDFHPAMLSGFAGKGYALVRRHGQGRVSCDGVFATTDVAAARALRRSEDVPFEGIVYSGEKERRLAMPVLIHSTQAKAGLTTFLFVSREDPFEDGL